MSGFAFELYTFHSISSELSYLHSFSLQAESIKASFAGKHVVVATMTSSGKSLCYNVPVLDVLSHDLLACALYLFPTKVIAIFMVLCGKGVNS